MVSNEPNQILSIDEGPLQGNGGSSDTEGPNWMDGWNQVELCTLQRNDPDINTVMCWKRELDTCPARKDLLVHSSVVRDLCG